VSGEVACPDALFLLVQHPPLGERTGVWRDADLLSAHPGNGVGRTVLARALLGRRSERSVQVLQFGIFVRRVGCGSLDLFFVPISRIKASFRRFLVQFCLIPAIIRLICRDAGPICGQGSSRELNRKRIILPI
jgi:fructose-1,6-bisphosphatase/inositol monophosphatase family enzyme